MSRDYDHTCTKCGSGNARRLGISDYYIYQCQTCGAGWLMLTKDIPMKAHGTDEDAWNEIADEALKRVSKEKKKIGVD